LPKKLRDSYFVMKELQDSSCLMKNSKFQIPNPKNIKIQQNNV